MKIASASMSPRRPRMSHTPKKPRVVQPVSPPAPANSKPAWNHGSFANDKPSTQEHTYINPKDRADYMRKCACFRCAKPGHFAKACPSKLGNPAPQVNNIRG